MAPSKPPPEFKLPLPVELLCEIITFLPLADLQTLSLTSRLTRSLALPLIFGNLRYSGDLPLQIHNIHQARKDVKEVIKKLELLCGYINNEKNGSLVIFQFLESLPNLCVLRIYFRTRDLRPAYISQLISSIRHTALLELVLETNREPVEGPPTSGLAGLEKLSVEWRACDNPNEPGSSLAHLYKLIQPTLNTLVELRIDDMRYGLCGVFDLRLLKPAADTLRTFEYAPQGADESILDTIPTMR